MLFYATGIIPMTTYNSMQQAVMKTVSSNRGLLSYPPVTLIDAVIAKFLLNTLTSGVVAAVAGAGGAAVLPRIAAGVLRMSGWSHPQSHAARHPTTRPAVRLLCSPVSSPSSRTSAA